MQIFTGKVINTKMDKTAKVEVVRLMSHPRYKKRIKLSRNYLVHDEFGVKPGQTVRFVPCKPMSKKKKWQIVEIVSKKGANSDTTKK